MTAPQQDTRRPLTIIVAMTPYGVIGKDGKIPWHVTEDMRRFKALTTGHAIVMGRKTWESIGRPLPDRTNIIVSERTLKPNDPPAGTIVCSTVAAALETAYEKDPSPFVIGGEAIYRATLPRATRLEITYIFRNGVQGDTFFPTFNCVHYPDIVTWSCISKVEVAGSPDVEFHTFVRRPT
jgi:dihydrofolate reductase